MKKLLVISSVAALLSISAPGFAATSHGVAAGPYVGAGFGFGGMDTPAITDTQKNIVSSKSSESHKATIRGLALRIFTGYLWSPANTPNLKVGTELGYTYYSGNFYRLSGDTLTGDWKWNYNGYNVDLLGVVRYYFANFNIQSKAGAAYVFQSTKMNRPAWVGTARNKTRTNSTILPKIAIGVGYDFTKCLGISVLYDHIFGSKPSAPSGNSSMSSISKVASVSTIQGTISYHFDLS